MDFSGQFRLDDESIGLHGFQTPIKHINQDPEANFNSQTISNRKFFVKNETPEKAKILFDSPKSQKKWSLKFISNRVVLELKTKPVAYKIICDKLIQEMIKDQVGTSDDNEKESKNLRRRVYDALNVMISIGLIIKDRKLLRWCPTTQENVTKQNLIIRKQKLKEQLKNKKEQATQVIKKQQCLQKLIELNKSRISDDQIKIHFPFLFVKTELKNPEEDELILESHKLNDRLKVLSKNPLSITGDLCLVEQLFQILK